MRPFPITWLGLIAITGCGKLSLGSVEGPSDGGNPDGAVLADAPPLAGLPGGCAANSRCWALRGQYAEALARARKCDVAAAMACQVKVVDSLGCSRCQIWVNDDAQLAPLRAQFAQEGCDRCFYVARADFRGTPEPATACPSIVCADPGGPKCTLPGSIGEPAVEGYCDSAALPTCPADLADGSICSGQYQYCFGGGHGACQCSPVEPPRWSCF